MAKSTTKSSSSKKAEKDQVKNILGSRHADNSDPDSSSSSSDSESDGESTLIKQIATPKKSTKTDLPSRTKAESQSATKKKEAEVKAEKPKVPKIKSVLAKSAETVNSSSEESSNPSSDSESEVEVKVKPAPMPAKKDIPKEAKKEAPKETSKKAAAKKAPTPEPKSSSESEQEEENSDVEMGEVGIDSDSDSEPEEEEEQNVLLEKDLKAAGAPPEVINGDFVLRNTIGSTDGDKLTKLFKDAASAGKQVWYFTAPADIPVEAIENMRIPVDDAMIRGEATFKQGDEQFALKVDKVSSSRRLALMLPAGKEESQYKCDVCCVDKVLNLRRLPPSEALITPNAQPVPKTYRSQPHGLKTRFRPLGTDENAEMGRLLYDTSDEEMAALPSPKKRKHAAGEEKPKKKRKDKTASLTNELSIPVLDTPDSAAEPKKEKKGKKDKKEKKSKKEHA